MSNSFTRSQRAAQHRQRLTWLRAHPELLQRLPAVDDDVDPDQAEALTIALRQMIQARLYAPTSDGTACRYGIRILVSELRAEGARSA